MGPVSYLCRTRMKSHKCHTTECAKIEQFAATLASVRTYDLCLQDSCSKDYTLEFHGRSIAITQQQFDDGTWQDIVRKALQGDEQELPSGLN